MAYYTLPPPALLRPFVRFFWVFELDGIKASGSPYVYRSMADGCPEILFHYRGIFQELTPSGLVPSFRLGLHAQSRYFRRFQVEEDFGIFGAYLYPFASEALLGIPAAALSGLAIGVEDLIGHEGHMLEEKLLPCHTQAARYEVMSGFLEDLARRKCPVSGPIHDSIKMVINRKGDVNINTLSIQHNLSIRQFQRKFKEASGYSPKLYTRILRFMEVATARERDFKNLTSLAYGHQYYDQSHFIHEFKEFSGYSPRDYFSGSPEGLEWLNG